MHRYSSLLTEGGDRESDGGGGRGDLEEEKHEEEESLLIANAVNEEDSERGEDGRCRRKWVREPLLGTSIGLFWH